VLDKPPTQNPSAETQLAGQPDALFPTIAAKFQPAALANNLPRSVDRENNRMVVWLIVAAIIILALGFITAYNVNRSRQSVTDLRDADNSITSKNDPTANYGSTASDKSKNFSLLQQEAVRQSHERPESVDAQVTAAKLEYQNQHYDQAIIYLLKANKLRPSDYNILAMLGVANMDAGHFDAAEKWYKAALVKKSDDIPVLDGYCAVLLSAGKAKPAEDAINKLAKLDPTNQDLPQFREKLASLKSEKK